MLLTNALLFTPEGFVPGSLFVEGDRIARIRPGQTRAEGTDLHGAVILPGLVDLHLHGAIGADVSDGDREGLRAMSKWLARRGVTSFLPTSVTLPFDRLKRAADAVSELQREIPSDASHPLGLRLEGPFLSKEKRGAQNVAWLCDPDVGAFNHLLESSSDLIRMVDLAPELPGAIPFLEAVRTRCRVSLGHTACDYETAAAAFDAGAVHLTHLFNAMPAIHHRAPGIIAAASERGGVTAELICDGLHVHPAAVGMAFRLFPDRLCLVSDAIRCCGMPEGEYELGGQRATLSGGAARLADGTIAGAASDLFDDLRNAIRFGIPREEAIRAATILPARVIGAEDEIGSLEEGKAADLLICGGDLSLRAVVLRGQLLKTQAALEPSGGKK